MSDDEITLRLTAEPMPPAPRLPWWRRWGLKLLRRPLPAAPQPPGTRPVILEIHNPDGTTTGIFYPAARIE